MQNALIVLNFNELGVSRDIYEVGLIGKHENPC
jgi:hypothetical protein